MWHINDFAIDDLVVATTEEVLEPFVDQYGQTWQAEVAREEDLSGMIAVPDSDIEPDNSALLEPADVDSSE